MQDILRKVELGVETQCAQAVCHAEQGGDARKYARPAGLEERDCEDRCDHHGEGIEGGEDMEGGGEASGCVYHRVAAEPNEVEVVACSSPKHLSYTRGKFCQDDRDPKDDDKPGVYSIWNTENTRCHNCKSAHPPQPAGSSSEPKIIVAFGYKAEFLTSDTIDALETQQGRYGRVKILEYV